MWIDASFDGANIEVIDLVSPRQINLAIRTDTKSDYRQWFYFRVLGAKGQNWQFRIVNAGQAAYPEAWPDGSVVASYDQQHWFRATSSYKDEILSFGLNCEADILYIALSPPCSQAQHHDLICRAMRSPDCALLDAIPTVENRLVEVLQIGKSAATHANIWIIARQHPGEPMAEWYMDGVLQRLLDTADETAQTLRRNSCFYLVPNMNLDGSIAGNQRTNAAGVDLNRAWAAPSKKDSPEVYFVREHMKRTGVDLFLDIHGDEELDFVFAAGCEGNPGYTSKLAKQDARFRDIYKQSNPDFSTQNGYPPDDPGEANLSIACNHVGETFGCLALTIEMPFKDNAERSDPIAGWSIARSRALGAAVLDPIANFLTQQGN